MKFKPSHRRTVVIFIGGLIIFSLWRQTNHALSPYGLSIWLGGLLVAFPALRIAPQQGFNASILLGLMVDTASPFSFGLHAFLFGIAHLIIVRIRNRLAVEETLIATVVALITNLALFLVISVITMGHASGSSLSGLRLLSDLLLSQLVLGLTAGWFFALQERALALTRLGILDEQQAAT